MPTYKDNNGKWYCKFYYQDATGKRRQKLKRGFTLKRDAEAWERDFLQRIQGAPDMTFYNMAMLYLDRIKINQKPVTYRTRESRVRVWLLPYFSERQISDISAADIAQWHTYLKNAKTAQNKSLSDGYIGTLHREISALFNFARRFYDLQDNPAAKAGNIPNSRKRSLNFWTLDQFNSFIDTFSAADPFRAAFLLLYYTGMRVGELQALTISDIDTAAGSVLVNKTYHIINGEHVTTTTKTAAGDRVIKINAAMLAVLMDHISGIDQPEASARVFTMTQSAYGKQLIKHAALAGLDPIRVHDLRHSHVSLLIDMGFSPALIAARLGHEKISITLDIYGHLYPDQQDILAEKLDSIFHC